MTEQPTNDPGKVIRLAPNCYLVPARILDPPEPIPPRDDRSGMRETEDGRFEVRHRALQRPVLCGTRRDARTVSRALGSTSEGPIPEPHED